MIIEFFSVNNIAFEVLGYSISWLELIGTIFNLACVILVARRNMLNWPMGLIAVVLFGILFYQINLYADMLEQVYYFTTGVIGWYTWAGIKKDGTDNKVTILTMSLKERAIWVAGIFAGGILMGLIVANIHHILPAQFPEPADFPFLDSITTTGAFAAQYLMIRRKLESWYLWIILDFIAVLLYWHKDVIFISLLNAILLINACYGWWDWRRYTEPTTPEPAAEPAKVAS